MNKETYIINPKALATDVVTFQAETIELNYTIREWLNMLNENALSERSKSKALNSNLFIKVTYTMKIYEQDTHNLIAEPEQEFDNVPDAIFYGDNEIGRYSKKYYEIIDQNNEVIYTSMV